MSRKSTTPISLPADPTLALEAVTKQYVDNRIPSGVDQQVLRRTGSNPTDMAWKFDGSFPIFASAAARDAAWTSPPNGARCFDTGSNVIWERVAGVWVPSPCYAAGRVTGNPTIPGSNAEVPITIDVSVGMGSNPPSRVIATYPGTYRLTASFTANVTTPVGQYVTVSCVQFRSLSIIANVDVVNSMNGNWCNAQIQTIFANVQAADQLAFYYSADGSGKALQGSRCWWTMERIGY